MHGNKVYGKGSKKHFIKLSFFILKLVILCNKYFLRFSDTEFVCHHHQCNNTITQLLIFLFILIYLNNINLELLSLKISIYYSAFKVMFHKVKFLGENVRDIRNSIQFSRDNSIAFHRKIQISTLFIFIHGFFHLVTVLEDTFQTDNADIASDTTDKDE